MEDGLLGAGGGQDLGVGVDVDAEAPAHVARDGGAQLGQARGGRVLGGLGDPVDERLADERRRGLDRVADREVVQRRGVGAKGSGEILEGRQRIAAEVVEQRIARQGHAGRLDRRAFEPPAHGSPARGQRSRKEASLRPQPASDQPRTVQ